ncbi:WD repeat-containing protein jip5 [Rhizina undulata]
MGFDAHTISLTTDLFTLSLHPTKPLLATGLLSGHVYTYTWPFTSGGDSNNDEDDDDDDDEDAVKNSNTEPGNGEHTVAWKTRRHKGSCRSVVFSGDGEILYSSGTDSLLKAASSETGRVTTKTLIPSSNPATTILPLSPHHLLLGTDSGAIHLFDTRTPSLSPPASTWKAPHDDYISSLTALPASDTSTSGFSRQFIATGDTTLTHLDVRKPNTSLAKSEDQEDELLCSAHLPNAPSRGRTGERILTGLSGGVVTVWNKGMWEDHQDRINISKASGESVDSIIPLPEFSYSGPGGGWGTYFATGSGDGKVRVVKMGGNKVVLTLPHSLSSDEAKAAAGGKIAVGDYKEGLEEGVVCLAVDCMGRIVSGGGSVVKVWYEKEDDESEQGKRRRKEDSSEEEEDSDDEDEDDSDEEKEKRKKRRKKRKGGKGKARSAGVKSVSSFKGLD